MYSPTTTSSVPIIRRRQNSTQQEEEEEENHHDNAQSMNANNSFLSKITNSMNNAKKRQISQSLPKLNNIHLQDNDFSNATTPSPTDVMVNKFMSQLEQHKLHYNNNTSGSEDSAISDSTNSPNGDYESSDDIISNVLLGSSYNNYKTSRSWSHTSHFSALAERSTTQSGVSQQQQQPSSLGNRKQSSGGGSGEDEKVKQKKLTKKRRKSPSSRSGESDNRKNEPQKKPPSKWFKSKFESSGSESEASDQDQSSGDDKSGTLMAPSQEIPDKKEVMLLFLMQHVCREYNPDPTFFSSMCAQLVENGYLSDERYSDQNYLKRLCKEFMVDVIQNWPIKRATTANDNTSHSKLKRSASVGSFLSGLSPKDDVSSTLPSKLSPPLPFFDFMFYSNSRFQSDFQHRSRIGKGAFGSVYRAKHRVDGHDYAIKKIKFSFRNAKELERTYTKIIREVKLLANLDHPNIVRYNQAWFEPSSKDADYSSEEEEEDLTENSNDTAAISDATTSDSGHNIVSPINQKVTPEIVRNCFASGLPSARHSRVCTETVIDTQFEFDEETDVTTPSNPAHIDINSPSVVFECYTSDEGGNSPVRSQLTVANPIIDIPPTPEGISFLEYAVKTKLEPVTSSEKRTPEKSTVPPVDNQSVKQAVKSMLADMFNEAKSKFEMFMFIQMQLCKQNTLQDYLNSEDRVKNNIVHYDECMNYFKQLVDGVVHIHDQSLIHRDLKPKNIFITTSNVIKIGDFGLAKSAKENIVHTRMGGTSHRDNTMQIVTRSSSPSKSSYHTSGVGTFFYASPEQYEGSTYDEKADIFSLGIILFELLHPFGSGHERALTLNDLRQKGLVPPHLKEKYPEEVELIMRCVQKEPVQRPTASDVLSNIVNIVKRRENHNSFGSNCDRGGGAARAVDVQRLLQEKDDEISKLKKELELLRSQLSGTSNNSNAA